MGLDATGRRRIIGAVFLLIALGMLIAGQTILKPSLNNLGFLIYWGLCFVFTGLAIVVAFRDARALRERTRRDARDLIENTLGRIEEDRKKFPPHSTDKNGD